MTSFTIGIAGAGVGGLAAAALLAQDGHNVTVFDQFDTPRPIGSGLVIQPVGQQVLKMAGAGSALDRGAHIWRMLGHEADKGIKVLDVSYTDSGEDRFGLAIHRATLFDALLGAALDAGIRIEPSHRVTGFDNRRFEFEGRNPSDQFDLLIDSSGASSALSPIRTKTLGYGAVWGTVNWPEDTPLPKNELRQLYRRASNMVGVLPLGEVPGRDGPQAAIFWSLPIEKMDVWREAGLDQWIGEATTLWPDFAPFVSQVTDLSEMTPARYSHGTLAVPFKRGIAFIGDAAHRASPQLGQGANMALLDAYCLREALRTAPSDQALQTYALTRKWHVRTYQMCSALFTPMYQSESRLLPVLRDRLLAPISQIPPVPKMLSHLVCGTMLPPAGRYDLENKPAKAR